MKKRFPDEQIISILRSDEAVFSSGEFCRKKLFPTSFFHLAQEVWRLGGS